MEVGPNIRSTPAAGGADEARHAMKQRLLKRWEWPLALLLPVVAFIADYDIEELLGIVVGGSFFLLLVVALRRM